MSTKIKLTPESLISELRKHNFGVLGTVSRRGRPQATGVVYCTSAKGNPLALYVMTARETKKVRNIMRNPNVSFVVTIPRTIFTFAPMNCIQFQGNAIILEAQDIEALKSFRSTRMGRMFLGMFEKMSPEETGTVCFVKIIPHSIIHTFGIGISMIDMLRNLGQAQGKVTFTE
jgi:uncharacterized protein YhbP (UPF0306 family)